MAMIFLFLGVLFVAGAILYWQKTAQQKKFTDHAELEIDFTRQAKPSAFATFNEPNDQEEKFKQITDLDDLADNFQQNG